MNNKGQSIGGFLIGFVAVIVGIALFTAAAQNIGVTRDSLVYNSSTVDKVHAEITAPAPGESIDLEGQEYLGDVIVGNSTYPTGIETGNYSIGEANSNTTGLKTIIFTNLADSSVVTGQSLNISYTYGADGYIEDGAGRSIAFLVVIFAALAIAVVAIGMNTGLKDLLKIGK